MAEIINDNGWLLGSSHQGQYRGFCEMAASNEELFKKFRTNPHIGLIIENSDEKALRRSYDYIKLHKKKYLKHWHKFLSSDEVGSPPMFNIGGHRMSPTTMRYIMITIYLEKMYGSLNGKKIVEIGAGYGGQCKIIHDLWKPKEYVIYDLPEVQKLQNKFLSKFGIEAKFKSGIEELGDADLVIAWCSWAELDITTKQLYIDKVISKADKYFLCCNYNEEQDYELLVKISPDIKKFKTKLYLGMLYTN